MTKVVLEFPKKLRRIFTPNRYKVMYGGRGGAKSWAVARALLAMGAQTKTRVLCAREFQNSIQESVHQLLESQVNLMGLDAFYDVQKSKIMGVNGTEFVFVGFKNTGNLRSYEGFDIVWVEEANNVSKSSWDILIPTIRKEGSEIWLSFNPVLESDETYKRFVLDPPEGAWVVKVNWRDNPWFPDVLRREKDDLKRRDPLAYSHVWEGECKQTLDGAIYAAELAKVLESGRRTRVPHDPAHPVYAIFDIGRSDSTAIWFVQLVSSEIRLIDYHDETGKTVSEFVPILTGRAEGLERRLAYSYETIWLPHDAENKTVLHPLSFRGQLKALMPNSSIRIVPRLSVEDGIHAARTIFGRCMFDTSGTQDGWQALSHYQYEIVDGQRSKKPLHNWASNGADSFRYVAAALREKTSQTKLNLTSAKPPEPIPLTTAASAASKLKWMRR